MVFFHLFLSALPYICLGGTVWLFRLTINASATIFTAFIHGSILWSLILWLQTNILSWLDCLGGQPVAIFWVAYFFLLCFPLWRHRHLWRLPSIRGWNAWALIGIGVITLITAIAYPPNNYDVLTYHMPRVMHWLQNHSLAPYPTSIDRQIGMAPFNAMIALQSFAPARVDYFVNLTQWLAFMGCLAGVMDIATKLGGNRKSAMAAAIFCATLPAAIVQASNTDSCLLVSFFMCACASLFMDFWKARHPSPFLLPLFGAALGLAILSKGSAYPIALPFVCLIAWRCLKNHGILLAQGFIAAAIIIALNAPHFVRAMEGGGSMVASSERNIVTRPTPGTFAVNALYNFISNQPLLLAGNGLAFWEKVSSVLGVEQDDKTILPWGGLKSAKAYYCPSDAVAPNHLQAIFLIWVGLAILLRKFKPPKVYTGLVISAFALFCLLLTWHPWITRIQLTLFILAAPVCGLYMAAINNRLLRAGVPAIFCICALWPLFLCVERPMAPASFVDLYRHNVRHFLTSPREMLLFNNTPAEGPPYMEAATLVAALNPDRLGLYLDTNGWEYPVWSILAKKMPVLPHIEHVITGVNSSPPPRYVWEHARHDTDGQQALRIIENTPAGPVVIFPKASEKPQIEHE